MLLSEPARDPLEPDPRFLFGTADTGHGYRRGILSLLLRDSLAPVRNQACDWPGRPEPTHPASRSLGTLIVILGLALNSCYVKDYTRHHVKECDYREQRYRALPVQVSEGRSRAAAIIPFEETRTLILKDLPREEKCVRGNLVYGLSQVDRELLDVFEGDVSHLPEWPTVSERRSIIHRNTNSNWSRCTRSLWLSRCPQQTVVMSASRSIYPANPIMPLMRIHTYGRRESIPLIRRYGPMRPSSGRNSPGGWVVRVERTMKGSTRNVLKTFSPLLLLLPLS